MDEAICLYTEEAGSAGNIFDFHSTSACFESRMRTRPSWVRFLVFLITSRRLSEEHPEAGHDRIFQMTSV
jgi:hypothetical protein